MTKYRELRNNIFSDKFVDLPYKQRTNLIYNIAKFETENRYENIKVLKCVRVEYAYNNYTIFMLVKNNNINLKTILICNYVKVCNRVFYNYVAQLSKYDFE